MQQSVSVGHRAGRFLLLVTLVATAMVVVVVTQRLSEDALALLAGLGCGVAVLLPALALMLWLWRRQEQRLEEVTAARPANVAPPVIVVAPSLPPGYNISQPALPGNTAVWESQPAERRFTIVGGED